MTPNEKARAYDEALEKARKYHAAAKSINDPSAARYENIFPELCESEDERIRKGLIEALKTLKTIGELKFTLPEPTREECIAYLEKQKEQKSIPIPPPCWESAIQEQKPVECKEYSSPECGTTAGVWSEEDDQLIGFIFDLLNDLIWRKDWAMSKEECLERLKSLRPS